MSKRTLPFIKQEVVPTKLLKILPKNTKSVHVQQIQQTQQIQQQNELTEQRMFTMPPQFTIPSNNRNKFISLENINSQIIMQLNHNKKAKPVNETTNVSPANSSSSIQPNTAKTILADEKDMPEYQDEVEVQTSEAQEEIPSTEEVPIAEDAVDNYDELTINTIVVKQDELITKVDRLTNSVQYCETNIDKINTNIELFMGLVEGLREIINKEGTGTVGSTSNNPQNVLTSLPLNSVEELESFNGKLKSDDPMFSVIKSQYKAYLSSIGGKNKEKMIHSAMAATMLDEVTVKYSWIGTKNTKKFSDSEIMKHITCKYIQLSSSAGARRACLTNVKECTKADIENVRKDWLRRAGDRIKIKTKKTTDKENEPIVPQD